MIDGNSTRRQRQGMTAIEVLASTILSALLMTALIGVLRGLKAHERTLAARRPEPAWNASLAAALSADLQQAETYQLTPQNLTLRGHGGRDEVGRGSWMPSIVVYEIRSNGTASAVVRHDATNAAGAITESIVLMGVSEIRAAVPAIVEEGATAGGVSLQAPVGVVSESPMPNDLNIEFWGPNRHEPICRHRHRKL